MQTKSLYIAAALLASIPFQNVRAHAQDAKPNSAATDGEQRGVSGIVSGKTGNQIAVQLPGNVEAKVVVTPTTTFRRYAPDSVTLAEAASGNLAEILPGDQIRARGQKSADGLTVTAGEVVSGTFWTRAGTITSIDPSSQEITIQQVGTNRPLVIAVAADSKLKLLPDMHMAGHSAASYQGAPQHEVPRTQSGAVDIAQVLSSMPDGKMGDLAIGGAVIVSGTKGASQDKVTAIMLLANAGMFVDMMRQQAEGHGAAMEQFLIGHGLNPAQGLILPSIPQ